MKSINIFTTLTLILGISTQSYASPVPSDLISLERRVVCEQEQGCNNCVTKGCAFSKIRFTCGGTTANDLDVVTQQAGCAQMNQQQGIFPAANAVSKAGIIPAAAATDFTRIRNHIFNGEATNPNSGRHTSTAWLATHAGQRPLQRNAVTRIARFPNGVTGKTVWETPAYREVDIKNMCSVAIHLTGNAAQGAFVVQTPFGTPACINYFKAGTGSCFPLGISDPPPNQGLGQRCGGGAGADAD